MKFRRSLLTVCIVVLAFAGLTGCGKKADKEYLATYENVGEVVVKDKIMAVCPFGWTNEESYDYENKPEKATDNTLTFVKGGTSKGDGTPYIKLSYYTHSAYEMPDGRDYADYQPVEATYIGDKTLTGYTASVNGQKFAYLYTDTEEGIYEIILWMHAAEEMNAFVSDGDVALIIQSLAH